MINDNLSGWDEIIPLEEHAYATIPFPVSALGAYLADYCYQVAASIQVDAAMVCVALLGILAGCMQRKYVASYHDQPLSLYVIVIASSGERKSPVLRALQDPINEYVRMTQRCPFLTDVTAEALEKELEIYGSTMILSAEGGIMEVICGRYSRGAPNLDAILKAHDGDSIYVKRITRQTEPILAPALSMAIMDQPCAINSVIANDTLNDRGVCARLLPCVIPDHKGIRPFAAPDISNECKANYRELILGLLKLPMPENSDDAYKVCFGREALDILNTEHIETEYWLARGADGIPSWGNKYMGLVIRLCCILCIADNFPVAETIVNADQAERAIDIAHYFRAQAVSVFSVAREKKSEEISHRIMDYLRIHRAPINRSELARALRGQGVVRPVDIDPALSQLEQHHYLKVVPPDRSKPGRPSSPMIMINPHAFD